MKLSFKSASTKEVLKGFFQDRLSMRLMLAGLFFLIFIFFLFFKKRDLALFPSEEKFGIDFYTDKNDNGISTVVKTISNDTVIGSEFILKKGFILPYAGINIRRSDKKWIDVSDYNRLEVELSTQNVTDVLVYLITDDQNVKDVSSRHKFRHSSVNLDVSDQKRTFTLNLQNFITPDWWYTAVGQPRSDFSDPEWEKLSQISFATGLNPKTNTACSIVVYGIRFYRDNTLVLLIMAGIEMLIMFGSFSLFFIKWKRNRRKAAINIHYKSVKVEEIPETGYSFLNYISENFNDPELSLQQISKETGVGQRFISDTISEKFECNFKTYINQIRVNEAKRLLKESKLNISEIAYSVGFSSPGSFNRVFKTMTGKTPSEFQEYSE